MLHLPRACLESFRQRFALLQGKTGGGSKDGEQHAARPAHDALEALAVQPGHSFAVAGLARLDKHAAAPAPAPTCPISQKRVALVVGNSAYPGAARPGNPGNDADDVAAVLRDKLCFAVTLAKDLKYEDFADKIGEFAERTAGADVALLYCAGHGMQVNATNWLVPVDAKFQSEFSVTHSNISAQEVVGQIQSRAKATIVILDACRNNPFVRSFRSGRQGLAQMDAPVGTLVAFSTAPGSVASDGVQGGINGLYTSHLLNALQRPGLKVEDVFKQVRMGVLRDSQNRQVPWEASLLIGDFYFRAPPPGQGFGGASLAPSVPPLPAPDPTPTCAARCTT